MKCRAKLFLGFFGTRQICKFSPEQLFHQSSYKIHTIQFSPIRKTTLSKAKFVVLLSQWAPKVASLTTSTDPKSIFCYSDWKNWSLCLCYDGFVHLPIVEHWCKIEALQSSLIVMARHLILKFLVEVSNCLSSLSNRQIYINLSATCLAC